jgi:hypothetical protein
MLNVSLLYERLYMYDIACDEDAICQYTILMIGYISKHILYIYLYIVDYLELDIVCPSFKLSVVHSVIYTY